MVCAVEKREKLVFTIPNRCRVCYTCVRECPVKAIRIENGQAAVMHERCIACGNCVKVCSQSAKAYLLEKDMVRGFLASDVSIIALLAPSFPAEFTEFDDHKVLVGILYELGFDRVCEVGFGADLVAHAFSKLLSDPEQGPMISSDCPSIVQFVEQYHPKLVNKLAPIVSPMVAMTRVVREKYGKDPHIVFIGPCIGKKAESNEIDAGITFHELRSMIEESGIDFHAVKPKEFDPPIAGKGGIFPVKRGLLQTLNIPEDLFEGKMVVAEGRANFPEAIAEFENGSIADQNMELLCCDGCIMGPGMSDGGKRFLRRSRVGDYMREKMDSLDLDQWGVNMQKYKKIDLSRVFTPYDCCLSVPEEDRIIEVLKSIGKLGEKDHLNCGACGYDSCRNHAIAIAQGFAETDMCLPHMIDKLANAQMALKQTEKLAHLGQLSAGIAHELNNPLGVVMMYANLMADDYPDGPMRKDIEMIVTQADRCKRIVGNLLNFARKNQVRKDPVEVIQLLSDSLDAVLVPDGVSIELVHQEKEIIAELDREQMMQVFTNLNRNAVEAMSDGGVLTVKVDLEQDEIRITIRDTGTGISKENMDKLFTPFFTTKEFGKGTGLGLATTYGILKMHKGRVEVKSNNIPAEGQTGTSFILFLPKNN
ncbi:MAG: 4Fe-4S dicluster domain-containing protein [Bacteroidetes bacterium]|jgi:iron only hydrogenase large subunit-like protein/nitrogen-specific signal transduction histidine kinase|nr:4Fe-4S dicluster domain-containing protein [Bacteroidota bacterium]MBT5426922.1 4Fe-4S dicluster domain-containing protein [Bacteroidota bacterium]